MSDSFGPGQECLDTLLQYYEEEVAGEAELINELEDFVNVPIDLVVGVPNFKFKQTPSPLNLESTMRNLIRQSMPQLMTQQLTLSNATYGARSTEHRRAAARATGADVDLPNEIAGGGSHDLFIYNLPPQRLAKGERAVVKVFSETVEYGDVYTWDVQTKHSGASIGRQGDAQSPMKISENDVWHHVELKNKTGMPWTTGAALIMDGLRLLGQDLLTYTPVGETVRVPVTVAVDVLGSFEDKETGRELGALEWFKRKYAKVSHHAKLSVCNHKAKDITLEINWRFGGKVDEVSDDGKHSIHPYRQADWDRYDGDRRVNNSSNVTWRRTLKPGEVFAPEVDYHYFLYMY